mgnify:CR=1 FL=1
MVTFLSGITPASAGKTTRFTWDICFSQDHPRECGKNSVLLPEKTGFAGSPPRVREKLYFQAVLGQVLGITPASAGKTELFNGSRSISRDHPRECGKNPFFKFRRSTSSGSPPRVREKLYGKFGAKIVSGITPASAGKTKASYKIVCLSEDHPRECGKNWLFFSHFVFSPGSPPRVREKLETTTDTQETEGITPASAGKTHSL